MKVKGKKIFLPISFVVMSAAIGAGIMNFSKLQEKASAAKEISATATASINVISGETAGKIIPRNNSIEYSIDITLNERAVAGDFVRYYLENLPDGMSTADVYSGNAAIGKAYFIDGSREDKYTTQIANTPKESSDKQDLTLGSKKAGVKIVFNENIEQLEDVRFSISNRSHVPFVVANRDYNVTSKVIFDGVEIAKKDLIISKDQENSIVVTKTGPYSVAFRNQDGKISSSMFSFYIDAFTHNKPVAGDILTYDLSSSEIKYKSTYSVGEIITAKTGTSTMAGQEVNANGAYLFDVQKQVRLEVLEHTSDVLKVKLLDDMVDGNRYLLESRGVDIVDPNAIDMTTSRVSLSKIKTVIADGANPDSLKSSSVWSKFTVSYAGTRITASDQISTIKSSVFVKYVDENGKEISVSKTLVDNKNYGTTYADAGEIEIEGYDFVELAKGSAPKTGKVTNIPQTIIYLYRKKPALIVAPEVPKAEVSKTGSSKVEAPNTGFGQNSGSIFAIIAGILTVLSVIFFVRKTSKVKL